MSERGILNFALRLNWVRPEDTVFRRALRRIACSSDLSKDILAYVRGRGMACNDVILSIVAEQALNRDSRVLLADKRDPFGLRRIALDWRLSRMDFRTWRAAVVELGRQMIAADIGRLRIADWLQASEPVVPGIDQDTVGGNHHIGTTRMSDDPRRGVVDRYCRVHGVDNLYIGGSSVFSTSGHANPTYTIVQLALRLGDHLHERLRMAQ
jgi:choline dehydrogenase-like flavoprotein